MKIRMTGLVLCAALGAGAAIPLPEHPRPDWQRPNWVNLNGDWKFAFDAKNAGERDKWFLSDDVRFDRTITVPFSWGSPLSGVKDEADTAWYRRDVTVPAAWKGKRIFLVVGASDHDTTCWLGGQILGSHSGGYTPFEFEITDYVKWGEAQKLTCRVWDAPGRISGSDWRLYGKQGYGNARGIWQTVYLEARGTAYLEKVQFTPDLENGSVTAAVTLDSPARTGLVFTVNFKSEDRAQPATLAFAPGQYEGRLKIKLRDVKLWDLDNPYLYEVQTTLAPEGAEGDKVSTYFGMRKIGVGKMPGSDYPYVTLNDKPIYLQLTLDQSYHPEGFYTFPSDEFMKNEILISKKLALSGNRVHIKVEIPRKLYWADKLGLLIMADVPCAWGPASEAMFREHRFCLEGMVKRDFNHPCIFSWVLFNETWGLFTPVENGTSRPRRLYTAETQRAVARAYAYAKELDPTRLVEDNSPCNHDHVITDLNTWHGYMPGDAWEKRLDDKCAATFPGSTENYIGGHVQGSAPMMNSECGNVWGYAGSTGDCDFTWDYHRMINAFRRHPKCAGWLYTEHHDVINEWNGYVRYDRTWKETGIGVLFPGSSLADWHAPAFVALDPELCREFTAGATWNMPLDMSFTTDKFAGHKIAVSYQLRYCDGRGAQQTGPEVPEGTFAATAWQHGRLASVPVRLPDQTAAGTICFTLKDGETVIGRNFACFVTRGTPGAHTVSVPAKAFAAAQWSQKQWSACEGLKVNGAGKGYFEYAFAGVPVDRPAKFRAEISAKRLNMKDNDGAKKSGEDLDYMLGGGMQNRSKNRNSYPQTSVEKWPGAVKVYANGVLVKTQALPDDPADHRGILSWFSQPKATPNRKRILDEAGSYGWLVEAEIPPAALAKAKDGKLTIRLEAEDHGLAVYGTAFGRFPFDPTVEF